MKFQPSDANCRVQVAHSATRFEKPFRELFLWAVLMNRYELARFMWEKGEEAVSDALVRRADCFKPCMIMLKTIILRLRQH